MAYLLIILTLCVISIVFADPQQSRHNHIGFMGTRGKRSINEESINNDSTATTNFDGPINNLEPNENELSRNIPGYLSNHGLIDAFGLRGRRIPLSAFNRLIINPNLKRAPSGFMGMRGKKQEQNFMDNKRAPVGFFGTRGKKDLNDFDQYIDNDDDIPQNFDSIDNNLYETDVLDVPIKWEFVDEYIKRVPTSGFFGMRGKKMYTEDDYSKRAPIGFLGMRGKKMYLNLPSSSSSSSLSGEQSQLFDAEKRKFDGFFGVRGKKDVSSQLNEEKRSSLVQFFGTRGKKQPLNSGFFGMRGKKEPFQFRGKFVGVRGKKSSEGPLNELETKLYDSSDSESHVDLINPLSDDLTMKRGPSGFVGMRGKKLSESGSDDMNNEN